MNRRQFLKRGVLGGALLGISGLAAWPSLHKYEPLSALVYLSPRAFQVLIAVVARMVPQAPDARVLAHRLEQSLIDVAVEARMDLERLLALFDNALAGFLLDGHTQPFTRMSEEQQDAVLVSWRDSRIALRRGGYQSLRKLSLAMYYLDEKVQLATGYPGPRRIPRLSYDDSMMGVAAPQPVQVQE